MLSGTPRVEDARSAYRCTDIDLYNTKDHPMPLPEYDWRAETRPHFWVGVIEGHPATNRRVRHTKPDYVPSLHGEGTIVAVDSSTAMPYWVVFDDQDWVYFCSANEIEFI